MKMFRNYRKFIEIKSEDCELELVTGGKSKSGANLTFEPYLIVKYSNKLEGMFTYSKEYTESENYYSIQFKLYAYLYHNKIFITDFFELLNRIIEKLQDGVNEFYKSK